MGDVNYRFLESEEALGDFLECFERGTWPKPEWTHAAHIAVAGGYLIDYSDEDAAERARCDIQHYNQCVGTINSDHSGSHETLTLFWLALVRARLRQFDAGTARDGSVRKLLAAGSPPPGGVFRHSSVPGGCSRRERPVSGPPDAETFA